MRRVGGAGGLRYGEAGRKTVETTQLRVFVFNGQSDIAGV
jgi:hypothetical protein